MRVRVPNSWKRKIHPAFLEIAELRRVLVQAQRKPLPQRKEAVQKVLEATTEKRYDLTKRYPDLSPGPSWGHVRTAGYKYPPRVEKAVRVFEWLFWKRFRIPLALALERERAGDLMAHKQLVRARDEFWQAGHGFKIPQFKVDETHSDLIELGFGLGLPKLSAEELADCFNSVCPCGKEHDADAMKKQRSRVQKQLQLVLAQCWQRTPPRERLAVFGANGYIARPYRPAYGKPYVEISRRGKGLEYVVQEGQISGYSQESEFGIPEVLSCLPRLFFVRSPDEMFEMFFPKDSGLLPSDS
jgi:hypothetical protein